MSISPTIITPAFAADLERLAASIERHGKAQREEIRRQQGINTILYAGLREAAGHIAIAQRDLMQTGLGQDPEVLNRLLEGIVERVSAAYGAVGTALHAAEMRVDLDGRDDVTVLARARTRPRMVRRRA